jgi:hypothetical protein
MPVENTFSGGERIMRLPQFKSIGVSRQLLVVVIAAGSGISTANAQFPPGTASPTVSKVIAQGGGRTIVQGGTGQPGFVPVVTTIAFHAEQTGQVVSGGFECLALTPASATGNGSGQFTVNAMYVTGQVKSVQTQGDTATLKGAATITGLGAGNSVPFTLVVRRGGPGSTAVLTTEGSPNLVFHEILLEGSFQVSSDD